MSQKIGRGSLVALLVFFGVIGCVGALTPKSFADVATLYNYCGINGSSAFCGGQDASQRQPDPYYNNGSGYQDGSPSKFNGVTNADCPASCPSGQVATFGYTQSTYTCTGFNGLSASCSASVPTCSCAVPAGNYQPPRVAIDTPHDGDKIAGMVNVGGWALDTDTTPVSSASSITNVSISVDGNPVPSAWGAEVYGANRSDVCGIFSGRPGCPNVGYNSGPALDTSHFPNGHHTITVTATDSNPVNNSGSATINVDIENASYQPPLVHIDSPAAGGPPISGSVSIGGWAVDGGTTPVSAASAITGISYEVDGTILATGGYGGSRSDVCSKGPYPGRPGCDNVGYNSPLIDTTLIPNGPHTITVIALDGNPSPNNVGSANVLVNVNNPQKVDGQCASPPNGGSYASAPSGPYCDKGTPTALSGSGPWIWQCLGINGGLLSSCTANSTSAGSCAVASGSLTPFAATQGDGQDQTQTIAVSNTSLSSVTATPSTPGAPAWFSIDAAKTIPANGSVPFTVHAITGAMGVGTYSYSFSIDLSGGAGTCGQSYPVTVQFVVTPAAVNISSIVVKPNPDSFPVGTTHSFTAKAFYSNGTSANLTPVALWSSGGPQVTSNGGGSFTGIAVTGGTPVLIRACDPSAPTTCDTASVSITNPVTIVSIAVNPSSDSFAVGQTRTFTAVATYSDGSSANITGSASWGSNSPGNVVSNGGGSFTGVATTGGSSVFIKACDPGNVSTCGYASVTIGLAKTIKSITITPNPGGLVVGQTQPFNASATYSDGTSGNITPTAFWSSGGPQVTSNGGGSFTGIAVTGGTPVLIRACDPSAPTTCGTASVFVTTAAPPACSSFTGTPGNIVVPQPAQLTWVCSNVVSCGITALNNTNLAPLPGSGSVTVTPTSTMQYTLTCQNGIGNTVSAQTIVTVTGTGIKETNP